MEIAMKPLKLTIITLLLIVVTLSCNLFNRPVVTEGPPFEVWTPTGQLPVETPTMTVEATLDQPVYARAQVGTYLSIWVTYDPGVWNAAPSIYTGVNQSNETVQQLVHNSIAGCTLHDNLGHGVPESWSWAGFTREIGQVVFKIDQWTDVNTNKPVLVIYQYPAGEPTNTTRRIELETGALPFDCIAAGDGVIALSIPDLTQ
jgi:hypothetical protein